MYSRIGKTACSLLSLLLAVSVMFGMSVRIYAVDSDEEIKKKNSVWYIEPYDSEGKGLHIVNNCKGKEQVYDYVDGSYTIIRKLFDTMIQSGDTVKLTSDIDLNADETLSGTLTISELGSLTIDLNGHTFTMSEKERIGLLISNSEVMFTDSVGGGRLVCNTDWPNDDLSSYSQGLILDRSYVRFRGISFESDSMYGITLLADETGSNFSRLTVDKEPETGLPTTITQNGGISAISLNNSCVLEYLNGDLRSSAIEAAVLCFPDSKVDVKGGTIESSAAFNYSNVFFGDVIIGADCVIDIGGNARLKGCGFCVVGALENTKCTIRDNAVLESCGEGCCTVWSECSELHVEDGKLLNNGRSAYYMNCMPIYENGMMFYLNLGNYTINSAVLAYGSKIYINGGMISANSIYDLEKCTGIFGLDSDIFIDGGTVQANGYSSAICMNAFYLKYFLDPNAYNNIDNLFKLVIKGGTINALFPVYVDNYSQYLGPTPVNISVSSGSFASHYYHNNYEIWDNEYKYPNFILTYPVEFQGLSLKFFTGGTFNNPPMGNWYEYFIADGYEMINTQDEIYIIVKKENNSSSDNSALRPETESSAPLSEANDSGEQISSQPDFENIPRFTELSAASVTESKKCGDDLTYELSDGTLTISGNGAMYDYLTGEHGLAPWFASSGEIKSVVIKDGVTSIGANAFNGCFAMKAADIAPSVGYIGNNAFSGCTGLKEIAVPSGVTKMGAGVFSECTALRGAAINAKLSELPKGIFENCRSLASVSLSSEISGIGDKAFYGCESLCKLNISGTIKTIGSSAFEGCVSLTGIDLSGVTEIGDCAFWNCKLLDNIVIPTGLKKLENGVFYGCDALKSVYIPENSIESIGEWAFALCGALESFTVSPGVKNIGSSAFFKCEKLKSVIMADSVTEMGHYVFRSCTALERVTLSDSLKSLPHGIFYECTSLRGLNFPTKATAIDNYAFGGCTALTKVTIPFGITEIGTGSFIDCTALKDITLPESLEKIGEIAFRACESLQKIVIPRGTEKVGEYAFRSCSSLEEAVIKGTLEVIELGMFRECTALKSITIPASLTTVRSGAFRGCGSISDVYFGGSERQWQAVAVNPRNNDGFINAVKHFNDSAFEIQNAKLEKDSMRLTVYTLNKESVKLAASVYDADGKLICVSVGSIAPNGDVTVLEFSDAKLTDGASIRIMMLGGESGWVPVCRKYEQYI